MLPFYRRSPIFASLVASLVLWLSACANSPNSQQLEQTLAADPRLQENPEILGSSTPSTLPPPDDTQAQMPEDFPEAIPLYPNAELQQVISPSNESADATDASNGVTTVWQTSDSSEQVLNFYTTQFQDRNWEIVPQPAKAQPQKLSARKGRDLLVTLNLSPKNGVSPNQQAPENAPETTEFTLEYARSDRPTTTQPNEQPDTPPENTTTQSPQPEATPSPAPAVSDSSDELNPVPEQLRPYVADLEKLGVLSLEGANPKSNSEGTSKPLQPNQPIDRRRFAQWLMETNNKIYANQPGKQIRKAPNTTKPAFQDVPQTDPDFPVIQGLAEAGIIPSPLSGDSTAVTFRPDAPLIREQLLLWKVPLDIRRNLPTTSVDGVQETWGFQDAAKIDPKALRAVFADYQNGELSNIRRAFGYTTLFQPKKEVTGAEAAAALWYFGQQGEGLSAQDALQMQQQTSQ